MQSDSHFNVAPPEVVVVDNFYRDPDQVRRQAMAADYQPRISASDPFRTEKTHLFPWVRERFMQLLGFPILDWQDQLYNGVFQWAPANTPISIQCGQGFTANIFLHPSPPAHTGIRLYRDRHYGLRAAPTPADAAAHGIALGEMAKKIYGNPLADPATWDPVTEVENVYNRLVIWNARLFHCASGQFGDTVETARLYQLFFFNIQFPVPSP